MIYLQPDDLVTDARENFINESLADAPDTLDRIEKAAIGLASTFLSPRYDTARVFSEGAPIRDELLADILVKIMLYRVFRRNAPRKVPADCKEDYEWAIKQLEKIQSGRITLALPAPASEDGRPLSASLYGNNSNPDFYI